MKRNKKSWNIYDFIAILCAVVTIIISVISLKEMVRINDLSSYSQLFLGLMFLFAGLSHFKSKRKSFGYVCMFVSVVNLAVFVRII